MLPRPPTAGHTSSPSAKTRARATPGLPAGRPRGPTNPDALPQPSTAPGSCSGEARGGAIVGCGRRWPIGGGGTAPGRMPEVPVLDHGAVLAAVSPVAAIEGVREALVRHRAGEWSMPRKVYLESPPWGDFRA